MPVYEIRYKPWEGNLLPPSRRLLTVPKFTLLGVWSKPLAVILFTGGALPVFGYTGYLLIITTPLVREALDISSNAFAVFPPDMLLRRLVLVQWMFGLLAALIAAPRMISTELANRALPLMYSRPLSRAGYIGGKFIAIGALLSLLTWIQSIVVWVIMYSLYPAEHAFHAKMASESLPLLLSAVVLGLMLTASLGLVALACSAATKSARYGALFFFALMAGASFFTNFIQEAADMHDFPNIGVREIVYHLGLRWMSDEATHQFSLAGLLFGLVAWCGAAVMFMLWRLRPVDIHGD